MPTEDVALHEIADSGILARALHEHLGLTPIEVAERASITQTF